jgi:hypothetical protein
MLDLIACTCSEETLKTIRVIIQVNYNEYIIRKITPFQQIN